MGGGEACAGINNPQFQREPGRYAVETVSLGGRPVTTAGGLRIVPNRPLEAEEPVVVDGDLITAPARAPAQGRPPNESLQLTERAAKNQPHGVIR